MRNPFVSDQRKSTDGYAFALDDPTSPSVRRNAASGEDKERQRANQSGKGFDSRDSSRAYDIADLESQVEDVRLEKVEQIRKAIETGSYQVDPAKVADAIIEEMRRAREACEACEDPSSAHADGTEAQKS